MSSPAPQFQKNRPPTTLLGKSLPASFEAERAVLSAILLNDSLYQSVADILQPADFYHPQHQHVFEAMGDIVASSRRIDLITLQTVLEQKKILEQLGGVIFLVSLQEEIPAFGFVEQHARIIKEKSTLRELIGSATNIITKCYDQNDDSIGSVLDEAEKTIFSIAQKKSAQHFVQLNIWLKRTFAHLSDVKSHSKGITGVPSGFGKLDEMTSGLQAGDLIILAARPSMGKTSLAINIAMNAALANYAVGIFSLEMSAEQLTLRILSTESGIAHHHIRNATISSDDWIELTNVAAKLAQLPVFIDDTAGQSIMDLKTQARKLKAQHDIKLLVVDYLQLLHSPKRHENRHQEVSEISRTLKALAKELGLPILALSQLSRAVDSRVDKRPMLSDLRESGAIEQDADVIAFLYRDSVYNPDTDHPHLAELIIGKQRNGPTGTVQLDFIRELTKFQDHMGD